MNKNYGMFGVAVQTAKGTPASKPVVSFPASADSDGIKVEKATESLNMTIGGRSTAVENYAGSVSDTAGVSTIGMADVLGLMLYAALGDDEQAAVTGGFRHTVKAAEVLPYLTFFEQKGSAAAPMTKMFDAKLDELKMTAEGVAPMTFEYTLAGCDVEFGGATAWSGPAFSIADGYYKLANAQVLFSLSSPTAGVIPAGIVLSSLELSIANGVEASAALGSAAASDQVEKAATVSVKLSGTCDSTDVYREVVTGSPTGTAVSAAIVTGALRLTFAHSKKADWNLVFDIPAIPWKCEVPQVSTDGGPFSLSLDTDGALDQGAGAITATICNALEAYTEGE